MRNVSFFQISNGLSRVFSARVLSRSRRNFKSMSHSRASFGQSRFPVFVICLLLGMPPSILAGPKIPKGEAHITPIAESTNKTTDAKIFIRVVKPGGTNIRIDVVIPPKSSAATKATKIVEAINDHNKKQTDKKKKVSVAKSGTTVKLRNLKKSTRVEFRAGNSGERQDQVKTGGPGGRVSMGFDNDLFDPTDADGLAAVFFGGITTDLGDLTVEVSAIDLVMTDGDSIVSAIFDELVSLAPSFGAQVVNQGRFLDFIFDPLLTQDGAGVFFGTTSLSEGAFGTVELFTSAPEPTTLTLLGLGLLGVGYARRRRLQ